MLQLFKNLIFVFLFSVNIDAMDISSVITTCSQIVASSSAGTTTTTTTTTTTSTTTTTTIKPGHIPYPSLDGTSFLFLNFLIFIKITPFVF